MWRVARVRCTSRGGTAPWYSKGGAVGLLLTTCDGGFGIIAMSCTGDELWRLPTKTDTGFLATCSEAPGWLAFRDSAVRVAYNGRVLARSAGDAEGRSVRALDMLPKGGDGFRLCLLRDDVRSRSRVAMLDMQLNVEWSGSIAAEVCYEVSVKLADGSWLLVCAGEDGSVVVIDENGTVIGSGKMGVHGESVYGLQGGRIGESILLLAEHGGRACVYPVLTNPATK